MNRRIIARSILPIATLVVVALLAGFAPRAQAQPCHPFFTDVSPSSGFCFHIEWLRNRAITQGCFNTTTFCPDMEIRRDQMAAFMHRLGITLTPVRMLVDLNPGPLNIQASADNYVCTSPPFLINAHPAPVGTSFPRTAVVHGAVWGLVDSPVVWSADLYFTTNNGIIWTPMANNALYNAATTAGGTQGSAFALANLPVGATYVFAIRVRESPDGPDGTGNFTDLNCRLMVEIGNQNGVTTPW